MKVNRLVALVVGIACVANNPLLVRAGPVAAARPSAGEQQVTPPSPGIAGTVLESDGTPAADVRLQLRNMDTGAIVGKTVSDMNGAFSFAVDAPGLYVVEAVDDEGNVLAVSNVLNPGSAAPGGTLVLPASTRTAAFFSSAAPLLAAAAGAGVAALTIGGRTVASPER